jgi:diguanylate cyclase (GGDEF)-like protein
LYVVNKDLNLELFKSKKENSATVIKEKSGDVFDYWVLRHSSPLLIEDVANDFRFEYSFKANRRPLGSLISVPMISEHRFFGTLRLDNPKPQSFDQDDLRFLSTISEIGATALENSELFARMTHLAIHDSLTGLYSKGYFLQRLQEEFYKALRLNRPLTLLMLDIDFFKRYNDTFGHTAGDLVLSKIGSLLQNDPQELKPLCARYGGEEFCVLLYGVPKAEGFKIASSLRQRIEDEEFVLRQQQTSVTVSVGLAALEDASDSRELLAKADSAMYQAKSKGRNQVCQA